MLRQYRAQRSQPWFPATARVVGKGKRQHTVYDADPRDLGRKYQIGTVKIGTIIYPQDNWRAMQYLPRREYCKNPWMVVAWLNREYYPAVRGGRPVTYMLGGHLAVIRSLRDGRIRLLADHLVLACVDNGLTKGVTS